AKRAALAGPCRLLADGAGLRPPARTPRRARLLGDERRSAVDLGPGLVLLYLAPARNVRGMLDERLGEDVAAGSVCDEIEDVRALVGLAGLLLDDRGQRHELVRGADRQVGGAARPYLVDKFLVVVLHRADEAGTR